MSCKILGVDFCIFLHICFVSCWNIRILCTCGHFVTFGWQWYLLFEYYAILCGHKNPKDLKSIKSVAPAFWRERAEFVACTSRTPNRSNQLIVKFRVYFLQEVPEIRKILRRPPPKWFQGTRIQSSRLQSDAQMSRWLTYEKFNFLIFIHTNHLVLYNRHCYLNSLQNYTTW